MKTLTYFRAYKVCRNLKAACEAVRAGGLLGIAIQDDTLALRWQRYERLERKLEQRLEAILSEN